MRALTPRFSWAVLGVVLALGLSAAAPVVTDASAAVAARDAHPARVGIAEPGRVGFGFVGRIEQNGPVAVDVGYLHYVAGLDEAQLFVGDDPLERDESSARLTYFANARIEHRSVNGNLFVTWGSATTTLFLQPQGGADFDNPASFRRGTKIATYESRWFDVVNVQAPNEGIARVESDDTQLTATAFRLDGRRLVFGRPGAPLRLSFTGQGTRSQAEPPRATIRYAGEATSLAARGGGGQRHDRSGTAAAALPWGAGASALWAGGAALVVVVAWSAVARGRRRAFG